MKYLSLSCALLIGILAILSISHVSCQETNHCKQDIANYLDDSSQTPVSDEQAKKEARKVDKLLESLRYKTIERELKKRVLSAVMDIYSLINDLNKILLDLKALSPHTAFGEVDQIKPREPSSELILKAMRDLTSRATMARRPEFAKQQARPMQDDQQARQAQETEKARQGREDEDKKSQSRTFATPATEAPSDEAAVAGDDYAKRFAEIHTPEEQEKFEKWMDKTRKKYGDIDFGPRKQELMERYMNEKQSGKPLDKALKILEKAYEDEYEDQKKEKKIAEKKAKMNPKQLQKFEEGEEKRRQRKFKKQQEKDDDLSTEGIMNSLGDALSGLFSW